MTKRDEIQQELIDKISKNFKGIHRISIRTGKCRIYLKSIQEHSKNYISNPRILILYPNIDIKKSWMDECIKLDYFPDITYSTYISVDKILDKNWDYIVADEAHLIPEENILPKIGELIQRHSNTILASGTYSIDTLFALSSATNMDLNIAYSTDQAIEDGIVNNFNVYVHTYQLDNSTKRWFGKVKKWQATEAKECARLSNRVMNSSGESKKFAALNRMRFINSCDSLINSVNKWINSNKDQRFLLFAGDENIGKKYNIPMYNSKSKNDDVLKEFQEGSINQLCLIKKGGAGITYPTLNTILITAINSNGEALEQQIGRSLLMDTDEANIHIFVSSEPFQQKWLNSALESINKERIKWL